MKESITNTDEGKRISHSAGEEPVDIGPSGDFEKQPTNGDSGLPSIEQDIEPLTLPLLARLFGVPLIIISTIVGAAVLVVVLFGAPSMPERQSVDMLLQKLESSSGERSLGILLPREKELWQTALELCERLTKSGSEFAPDELNAVTERLVALVRSDLETVERLPTVGAERENQRDLRSHRLEFVLRALGRTRHPVAVQAMLDVVAKGTEQFAAVAARELGDLHDFPGVSEAVGPVTDLLNRAARSETKLVACTVLSVLAKPGDQKVLDALSSVRSSATSEVSWSAALALARLGSSVAKSTMLDLLDRSFWEKGDRYETVDAQGLVRRYPMPPGMVDAWLQAAIDAGAKMNDPEVNEAIRALSSDRSLPVRSRATEILKAAGSAETQG